MLDKIHDVIGVGFGPAGIALASAIEDWREKCGSPGGGQVHFLESAPRTDWQPGLLIRGADINHHFFRDFATPRDPRSRFTFANYLKENDRLFHFGHLGGSVGRLEWADYVRWTAEQLSDYVSYNQAVTALEPYPSARQPELIRVTTASGQYLARTLVLGTGPVVNVPRQFEPYLGERFFHTSQYLDRIADLDRDADVRFGIIGSGQSAGEILNHLHDSFPRSRLYSIHRNSGFKLVDLGHFSNEVYFPPEVDYYYPLTVEAKRRVAADVKMTNYASIDWEVSRELYWRIYEDRIQRGDSRIEMLIRRRIADIDEVDGAYRLSLEDLYTGEPSAVTCDRVIVCTGYTEELFPELLEPLRSFLRLDEEGGLRIGYDYQLETVDGFGPRIFVNGMSERTHGISDSASFSMTAIKAERIWQSIRSQGMGEASALGERESARAPVELRPASVWDNGPDRDELRLAES